MNKLLNKIQKIDNLSKIFLISITGLIIYILYLQINSYLDKRKSPQLVEVAEKKSISLNDFFFEYYQRNRQSNDNKMYIKINETLNEEQFKKLEFRLNPKQDFSVNLKAENLIEIIFNQKSPADFKENTLIVLESGKQLFRIVYKNLRIEDSRADEVFINQYEKQ